MYRCGDAHYLFPHVCLVVPTPVAPSLASATSAGGLSQFFSLASVGSWLGSFSAGATVHMQLRIAQQVRAQRVRHLRLGDPAPPAIQLDEDLADGEERQFAVEGAARPIQGFGLGRARPIEEDGRRMHRRAFESVARLQFCRERRLSSSNDRLGTVWFVERRHRCRRFLWRQKGVPRLMYENPSRASMQRF